MSSRPITVREQSWDWRRVGLLVGVAVAVRGAYWMLATPDYTPLSDASHYHDIATNLAQGEGFSHYFPQVELHPTAFRPPLYPGLLGLAYWILWPAVGIGRALNLVLGVVVVLLAARLASRVGGPRAGLAAGLAAAVHPSLVANDVSTLTEPLSLLLMLALVLFLLDRRLLLAGAATGLLVLSRSSAQGLVLVLAGLVLWRFGWARALRFAAVAAVVVAPWAVRNWVQLDAPVLVTSNGFNLAAIYSEPARQRGAFVDPVFDPAFEEFRLDQFDEARWDRALRREAIRSLRAHPGQVLSVVGHNTAAYLELRPSYNERAEVLDGRNMDVRTWTLPLFYGITVAGLIGLWRERRHLGTIAIILVAASFTALSLLLVAPPRLRAPFDLACCIGIGLLVSHSVPRRRNSAGADPALPVGEGSAVTRTNGVSAANE